MVQSIRIVQSITMYYSCYLTMMFAGLTLGGRCVLCLPDECGQGGRKLLQAYKSGILCGLPRSTGLMAEALKWLEGRLVLMRQASMNTLTLYRQLGIDLSTSKIKVPSLVKGAETVCEP